MKEKQKRFDQIQLEVSCGFVIRVIIILIKVCCYQIVQ